MFHPGSGRSPSYVEDVDAAYGRVIRTWIKSIVPPEDKRYDERQAGFIDPGGNT